MNNSPPTCPLGPLGGIVAAASTVNVSPSEDVMLVVDAVTLAPEVVADATNVDERKMLEILGFTPDTNVTFQVGGNSLIKSSVSFVCPAFSILI